jgi:hypothetical protein
MLAVGALGAGVAAAVVSSWINDGPLGNASPAIQNLALVGEGLAAIYYVENPAHLGGIIVGLGLVTAGNLVYSIFPGLAAPTPMTLGGRGAPSTNAGPMGALHQQNVRQLRALDKNMQRKHRRAGLGIGTLHTNLGALHMGTLHRGMGALHANDMGALPQVATSWRSSVARMGRG